ncbi:MAG: DUF4252 domain-containing protein [Acidobacteria bacterium]|nr:DUF4252 domain-containing protein [Acidobacteriota bacterium]
MKLLFASIKSGLLALLISVCIHAQDARVPLEPLDKLANVAHNTVEVSLDQKLLAVASKFLNANDPTQAKIKELVAGLQGVYVRVFSFDKPGEYSTSDIDPIRNIVKAAGWQKIVGVRSKRDGDNVDVHLRLVNDNIHGLVIIAAQPKELVVVNILGPIDLEKLSQLQGQMGIPKLDLDFSKSKVRD